MSLDHKYHHDSDQWNQDPLQDQSQDEQKLQYGQLAQLSKIIRFSAEYWGGVSAVTGMVLLFLGFGFLTISETVESGIMSWLSIIKTTSHPLWWSFGITPLMIIVAFAAVCLFYIKNNPKQLKFKAWVLSSFTLFLASASVKLNVGLAMWSKEFYDAIQNRNEANFAIQIGIFIILAIFWVLVGTYRTFFQQMIQIQWRTWLTERFTARYFVHNRFYFFNQQSLQDNPDQRISEDLNKFTELAVYLFFGAYISATSVYEFSKLMIEISGDYQFNHWGLNLTIPYYLFWMAVIYAILGSIIIHFIGRRVTKLEVLRQRYNANFRYHLIRAREYAEGIALSKGTHNHYETSRELFGAVRTNWYIRMWTLKLLGFASSSYGQASVIFPIILMAPRYFADKAFTWGNFMQVLRTFSELRESLSWFIDQYQNIAELRGTATRLFNFEHELDRISVFNQNTNITVTPNNTGGIAYTSVSLKRPHLDDMSGLTEQDQVQSFDWQISQNQNWLITGASGSGKSTIIKAAAALWPYGSGHIDLPAKSKLMFLPQKPYFPMGSLREALAYPQAADTFNDAAYETALDMAQLSHLKSRLAEHDNWLQILSGGEQQRLAFARVFLVRPHYLFLDEATASLDPANEEILYQTLKSFLPQLTLVSVSHHKDLKAYHDHELHLSKTTDGTYKAKAASI